MVDEGAPEAERTWVHIVVSTLGAVVTAAVLVALYYVLPLDDLSGASAVTGLALGIVVLVMLIGWQVRRSFGLTTPGAEPSKPCSSRCRSSSSCSRRRTT